MGGQLRVIGRQMAVPLVSKDHQKQWQADTNAYAEALRMLTNVPSTSEPAPRKTAS
jgi:hypothetical protein